MFALLGVLLEKGLATCSQKTTNSGDTQLGVLLEALGISSSRTKVGQHNWLLGHAQRKPTGEHLRLESGESATSWQSSGRIGPEASGDPV